MIGPKHCDGRFLVEPETLAQLQAAEELRQIRTVGEPAVREEVLLPVGAVVRLKSGGPKMVVTGVIPTEHLRECVWFDEEEGKQSDTFEIVALETADE